MKLLFDQNLSHRLCGELEDIFSGSAHVRPLGLAEAEDRAIWDFARLNGFTIVFLDADFADMAVFYGPPPKVIGVARRKSTVRRRRRSTSQPRRPNHRLRSRYRLGVLGIVFGIVLGRRPAPHHPNAVEISSIRSSTSSSPTDSLSSPGPMPRAARCSGFSR